MMVICKSKYDIVIWILGVQVLVHRDLAVFVLVGLHEEEADVFLADVGVLDAHLLWVDVAVVVNVECFEVQSMLLFRDSEWLQGEFVKMRMVLFWFTYFSTSST